VRANPRPMPMRTPNTPESQDAEDVLPEEFNHMTAEAITQRARLLDNEIRVRPRRGALAGAGPCCGGRPLALAAAAPP
jgi:hypothetical protein